jgi:hypothetical protein
MKTIRRRGKQGRYIPGEGEEWGGHPLLDFAILVAASCRGDEDSPKGRQSRSSGSLPARTRAASLNSKHSGELSTLPPWSFF